MYAHLNLEADPKLRRTYPFPLELIDFYYLELGLIEDPAGRSYRWQSDMVQIYQIKHRIQIEQLIRHKTVCPWLGQAK